MNPFPRREFTLQGYSMSRLLVPLPYAEVAMPSRSTAPAPITIVAAALILLLSFFSALSRADETGTTFS